MAKIFFLMVSELSNQMDFVSMEITLASKEKRVESTRSVFHFLLVRAWSLVPRRREKKKFRLVPVLYGCHHSALAFGQLHRNYIYTLHSQCSIATVARKTVAWRHRLVPVSVCGSGQARKSLHVVTLQRTSLVGRKEKREGSACECLHFPGCNLCTQ